MSAPAVTSKADEPKPVQLQGVIGFNGSVPGGVLLHPSDQRLLYPLGSTIVVKELHGDAQHFLSKGGHDRDISALALSPCGRFLASGQSTHMGFVATIVVWDLTSLTPIHKWSAHKGKVQSLSFSCDSSLLASVGGRDDMKLIIWDLTSGQPLCNATAANDSTSTVKFLNHSPLTLITGGSYSLRVWTVDTVGRKLTHTDCQLGQLKRVIADIAITDDDSLMYCGTTTGDVLTIDIKAALYKGSHPSKLLIQGVTRVLLLPTGFTIVGTGDGSIHLLSPTHTIIKSIKLTTGAITSLTLTHTAPHHFFIGTDTSQLYLASTTNLEHELRMTCHTARITAVAYPQSYSEVFATAAASDIRVWNARTLIELLRIEVAVSTVLSLCFASDGKSIISGWADGKIRAFTPQSGTPLWCIEDAHLGGGVTALCMTHDNQRLLSGGENGSVRVWSISRHTQSMLSSMKEHQQRVNEIIVDANDEVAITASNDGSCILWSLSRYTRLSCLFASTQFKSVCYHPDFSQLLTSGSDRKLMYWDITTGEIIRVMEGGISPVNSVDISCDGEIFITGGEDKLIRVWTYDQGVCGFFGVGHAGAISHVKIAPDSQSMVSVGEDGAIMVWKMPAVKIVRDGREVVRVDLRAEAEAARLRAKPRLEEEKEGLTRPARANKKHVMHVRQ